MGHEASASLENILTEFDDLFLKHKADICRCTIAKHQVEVGPAERQNMPIRRCAICLRLV